MSQPPDLRVALVGYGLAGEVFHAPIVAATPGMRLAAIVTTRPERAERARQRCGDVSVYTTAPALWTQAPAFDLAVIASPNATHVPLALDALSVGLPVVIDKPIAATAAEARRLVQEARRRRLLLTVFQNRRWDGDFLTLQRLIKEERLGRVSRFESRFERWRPTSRTRWRESGDPADAGGILFDIGPHLVDQALQLFGPVKAAFAELDKRRPGVVVEDDAFVALEHLNGVRSHLWMSMVAPQPGPRFRVVGSRAVFLKRGLDPQEGQLKIGLNPGEAGYGEDPAEAWGSLIEPDGATEAVPTVKGAYVQFYEGVAAALRSGAAPPVDPADAIAGLEIIEACRRLGGSRRRLR